MNGILLINKEKGMTSHDVVNRLRKILHMKKIGHTGTLDPQASGLLVVLLGTACKALPYLEDVDKEYIAEMELGRKTISDDIWGEVQEVREVTPIADFPALVRSMIGVQQQVPPLISSIKVNGKKLYEYARAKQSVTVKPRQVEIYEMEVLEEASLRFRCRCSSGTYVRAICRDMALQSGNLGCMKSLVRTQVGRFKLRDAVTLEQVEKGMFQIIPLKEALRHYPQVALTDPSDVLNGKHLRLDVPYDQFLFTYQDEPLAIYRRHHDCVFACVRGLW